MTIATCSPTSRGRSHLPGSCAARRVAWMWTLPLKARGSHTDAGPGASVSFWRKAMFFEDILVPVCSLFGLDVHPLARTLRVAGAVFSLLASIQMDRPRAPDWS